jgi:Chlorophyll A-B binding protein
VHRLAAAPCSQPAAFTRRYRQSELQHARWAMLGVAGILVQEITRPDVFWCVASA